MHWTATAARLVLATCIAAFSVGIAGSAAAEDPGFRGSEQAQEEGAATETLAVTGTIEAEETDLLGRTTAVKIVSPEMGSYRIADDQNARELAKHVGQTVTLTARRTVDEDGRSVLSVSNFVLHEG